MPKTTKKLEDDGLDTISAAIEAACSLTRSLQGVDKTKRTIDLGALNLLESQATSIARLLEASLNLLDHLGSDDRRLQRRREVQEHFAGEE